MTLIAAESTRGNGQPGSRTGQCEHEGFGEKLGDERAARCAQGLANGDFTRAPKFTDLIKMCIRDRQSAFGFRQIDIGDQHGGAGLR